MAVIAGNVANKNKQNGTINNLYQVISSDDEALCAEDGSEGDKTRDFKIDNDEDCVDTFAENFSENS